MEWELSGSEDDGMIHVCVARRETVTRGCMLNMHSERFDESPYEHASCTDC